MWLKNVGFGGMKIQQFRVAWQGSLLRKGFQQGAQHVRRCRLPLKSCLQCLIHRYTARDVQGLPAWVRCIQDDQSSGPWMELQVVGGQANFGCKVCKAAGTDSDWGRISIARASSAHGWRLRRHACSQSHQVALASSNFGKGVGAWKGLVSVNGREVPETDIFLQVLQGHQSCVFLIVCFILNQHTKHTKPWSIALNKTSSYSRTTTPGYQAMEIAQTQAMLFGRCQALQSTESAGL